jgi:hypothetical protein
LTPGQRHRGPGGLIVCAESSGETSEGREGTGGGARQPRIKLGRLALADHASKVLRQRHRLCQVRWLRSQLRQLAVILRRRPLRRTEDQPGRPTRSEQVS